MTADNYLDRCDGVAPKMQRTAVYVNKGKAH